MRPASHHLTVRRTWRVGAAAGLVAGALVAVATPAAANQFTVNTVADSGAGSLRQAVLDANANAGPDEITFDPSIDTQTIMLTSDELSVTEALTVTGNGATNTIIDGNASSRIFKISGADVTISGATLQNALASTGAGGAIDSDGAVTLEATTLTGNSAANVGGGLFAAAATIRNGSVVRANHASASGGGGVSVNGDATVSDSTIGGSSVPDGNTAGGNGGGILAGGTATITNSIVRHNSTTDLAGGGVDAQGAVVTGSTVSDNTAGIAGGGIHTVTTTSVSSSTVSSNTGGIRSELGPVTVTGSTISSNSTGSPGGGIDVGGGLTLESSTISSNTGAVGGGVFVATGDVTISDSWFDQNSANTIGGGVGVLGFGTETTVISDSTFSANRQTDSSLGGGGGIALVDVNATLTNVTAGGNAAAGTGAGVGGGGGILVATQGMTASPAAVTIVSSTIDGNAASPGAGLVVGTNAPSTSVASTILSNNTGGPGCDGAITDAGFNLLFNTAAGSCVFGASSDVTGADPGLGALTLNAPATLVPTMALSAGSPALDVVTSGCPPPATDARGVTRPQGDACDAGAFELAVAPAPSTIVTTTADSGVGSLRQAVLDANANPGPDEITFDPSIDTQTITLTSGQLVVTEALTVTGNGATNTIIDGNASSRIFNIGGADVIISGARLQNGLAPGPGGGAVNSDAAVTLDATTLTDNSASAGVGGGLNAAAATIRNGSVVRANQSSGGVGGGVAATGDATVSDSTIGGSSVSGANTAGANGGGLYAGGTATITNSTVRHNTTTGNGGGVSGDTAVVVGSTISDNTAITGGAISTQTTASVSSSTISSNTGGGIGSDAGPVTVTDSTISSNTTTAPGGGIYTGGALTVSGSTIASNAAAVGGGAFVVHGAVTISDSWFDHNTVTTLGGGIGIVGTGTETTVISDSTFSANQQTGDAGGGGGLGLVDVNATLTNVTVSGNTAAGGGSSTVGGGGGIAVATQGMSASPAVVTIRSSTIDANTAEFGAGITFGVNAPVTSVVSTILANNVGPACDGTITDGGFNLLFNTDAGTCVLDAANDVTGADPELGALTLNAPATLVPTMALSAGSPALDAVTAGCPPPATDARGVTRPQGDACDIGAFELAVTPPPPTTTTTTAPTTTTTTVGPASGEGGGSGASGTLPFTGWPGPALALLGVALLTVGALLELAPHLAQCRRGPLDRGFRHRVDLGLDVQQQPTDRPRRVHWGRDGAGRCQRDAHERDHQRQHGCRRERRRRARDLGPNARHAQPRHGNDRVVDDRWEHGRGGRRHLRLPGRPSHDCRVDDPVEQHGLGLRHDHADHRWRVQPLVQHERGLVCLRCRERRHRRRPWARRVDAQRARDARADDGASGRQSRARCRDNWLSAAGHRRAGRDAAAR